MAGSAGTPIDGRTISESKDPNGLRVVLLAHIWGSKILPDHREMSPYLDDVLRAVAAPDHTAVDPVYENRQRFYLRDAGSSRWLLVVVSYEQDPARIISAFGNRKDPPSWNR
jgi:hypothetical protein